LITPDLFTPNGDGTNDEFVIDGLEELYPNFEMVVFNRYGNEVYRYRHNGDSSLEPDWWTGTSQHRRDFRNNEELPVGTYYYLIYKNNESNPNDNTPIQNWIYLNR